MLDELMVILICVVSLTAIVWSVRCLMIFHGSQADLLVLLMQNLQEEMRDNDN